MPVFLSDQLKDAGVIRIEILKYLSSGNKRFLLWVTEMDNQSMVHEFSSLLSIDTFSASTMFRADHIFIIEISKGPLTKFLD